MATVAVEGDLLGVVPSLLVNAGAAWELVVVAAAGNVDKRHH